MWQVILCTVYRNIKPLILQCFLFRFSIALTVLYKGSTLHEQMSMDVQVSHCISQTEAGSSRRESSKSLRYSAMLCDGCRFLFAVLSVYLLQMKFKTNNRKQNKHVCISYWIHFCFYSFIIYLFLTVFRLN